MKTKITLLAIVACALLQVAASADQTANQISVSKAIKPGANAANTANAVTKLKPLIVTPLSKSLLPSNDKIQRAGNVSSRSWTQTVGWTPGKSEFPSESTGPKDQGLTLFWVGHEPW
jgi:hypothetical protein